jgi:two-component system response regulator ResD
MEKKKRILIVEDDEKIRGALKDFLDFKGFDVFEAADGPQAVEKAAKIRADLILLDLMLPKISGEELCKRWRQEGIQ